MPRDNLHITALEVTHSKTAPEIQKLVDGVRDKIPAITDYTYTHRARLIKPLIGYDASALALSFVPAAGEGLHAGRTLEDDKFTYHHLRRDLFSLCRDAGVNVESRYVVPSSHLTIGRYVHKLSRSQKTQSLTKPSASSIPRILKMKMARLIPRR